MKLPDLYTDGWIIAGLVLMILGTGNWIVGLAKTEQYSRILARISQTGIDQSYLSFEELDDHADNAVLAPLIQDERKLSYATAHMDFYHAAFLTGQVLFGLGVMVTVIAFIAAVRRDARGAMRRTAPKFRPSR